VNDLLSQNSSIVDAKSRAAAKSAMQNHEKPNVARSVAEGLGSSIVDAKSRAAAKSAMQNHEKPNVARSVAEGLGNER